MQDNTEGILRIGSDATDFHGSPGFLRGGKFEKGDVFFPGSGYDAAKLESEYGELAKQVDKYAANPSLIESASKGEQDDFLAQCRVICNFLEARLVDMSKNVTALSKKLSKCKAQYHKRQTARAKQKEAKTGGCSELDNDANDKKAQDQQTKDNNVSDCLLQSVFECDFGYFDCKIPMYVYS